MGICSPPIFSTSSNTAKHDAVVEDEDGEEGGVDSKHVTCDLMYIPLQRSTEALIVLLVVGAPVHCVFPYAKLVTEAPTAPITQLVFFELKHTLFGVTLKPPIVWQPPSMNVLRNYYEFHIKTYYD
jgi:hypothetical protein